jgi:hypothetical protein
MSIDVAGHEPLITEVDELAIGAAGPTFDAVRDRTDRRDPTAFNNDVAR